MAHHIAQLNVGRTVAPLDTPQLADFMAWLDAINAIADASPGFLWRLQGESGNNTDLKVGGDPLFIVNMSVWESIEALHGFTYRSGHKAVFARATSGSTGPTGPTWSSGGCPPARSRRSTTRSPGCRLAELGPTAEASRSRPRSHRPTRCRRDRRGDRMIGDVVISPERPTPDARRLIDERRAPGFRPASSPYAFSVDRLLEEGVEFFVLRAGEAPPAADPVRRCGGGGRRVLRRVKRMFVARRSAVRGSASRSGKAGRRGAGPRHRRPAARDRHLPGGDRAVRADRLPQDRAVWAVRRRPLCAYFERRLRRRRRRSPQARADRAALRPEDALPAGCRASGVAAAQALGRCSTRVIDVDGRIRVEDLLTAGAAVCGESCIAAAGELDPESHRLVPGSAVLSDRINEVLCANASEWSKAGESVFGVIHAGALAGGYAAADFPELADVFRVYVSLLGGAGTDRWGFVGLSVPEANWPLVPPLRYAYDLRTPVRRSSPATACRGHLAGRLRRRPCERARPRPHRDRPGDRDPDRARDDERHGEDGADDRPPLPRGDGRDGNARLTPGWRPASAFRPSASARTTRPAGR
jgi:hypothetical protein